MADPRIRDGSRVRVAARTERGRRGTNEDAFFARVFDRGPWVALLGVADGLGGHSGGAAAAEVAVGALARAALAVDREPEIEIGRALDPALDFIDAELARHRRGRPDLESSGTTLTLLAIRGTRAQVRHAGDSRLYRHRGAWDRITEDHNVAFRLHREGALRAEEVATSPLRSRLYRYLGRGAASVATMERYEFEVEAGDRFLLVTDGCFAGGEPPRWRPDPGDCYDPDTIVEAAVAEAIANPEDDATAVAVVVDRGFTRCC